MQGGLSEGDLGVAVTDAAGAKGRNNQPGGSQQTSRIMGQMMLERVGGYVVAIAIVAAFFGAFTGFAMEAGIALAVILVLAGIVFITSRRRRKLKREADLAAMREENEPQA